ncbi:MAG TPA: aminotransferase class I/II-fold pyridoxal phosphate-dependent enzyme [Stellaceae bacterium]|nr:aminotransferase class I/II-fold pyridoxal phosphate-dependent enzyme [Stellaceae bacterium]
MNTRPAFERSILAAMPPGVPPQHILDFDEKLRALHLNECPLPPSPHVVAAIAEAAAAGNRYPDPRGRRLLAMLAERTGIPAERIMLSNGSEELIGLVSMAALDPGDEVVLPTPSFPRYAKAAALAEAMPVRTALTDDGRNDVDALLAAITPRTRLVWCATPNNPTGQMNDAEELARLIAGVPSNVLLVVDEAYFEFGRHAGGPDVLSLLRRARCPWVVLRTFSKAYCLAGLRLGYTLASAPEVIGALAKLKATFNVGALAQAAAVAALGDEDHLARVLDNCAEERRRLDAGARRLGLAPLPTVANFIAMAVPGEAASVIASFRRQGILINGFREAGYEKMIRISIGTHDDTDAVLAALAVALDEAQV